ncbi:MAG TPA: hypothetical protein PK876_10935 [Elusimicrobiota bacterium]|nr:hypothetical protein [Elusimicrobiota bacterium]
MKIWFLLVAAVFASFFVPAYSLMKDTKRLGRVDFESSFHRWFLSAFFWLMGSFFTGIVLALDIFLNETLSSVGQSLFLIHREMTVLGFLIPAMIGAFLWINDHPDQNHLRWTLRLWNALLAVQLALHVVRPGAMGLWTDPLYLLMAGIIVARTPRQPPTTGSTRRGSLSIENLSIGLTLLGGILILLGPRAGDMTGLIGQRLLWGIGFLGFPMLLTQRLIEEVTGTALYSRRMVWMMSAGWAGLCLLSAGQHSGGRWGTIGTVAAVGLWLPAGFMATNIWETGEHLRSQTVDELAARWKALGSWMPSSFAARWLELGWLCLFGGIFLWSVTSFQNVTGALQNSFFRTGLIYSLLIGGVIPVYLSTVYCAWAKSAIPVSERVADIAYWHYLGGCLLVIFGFLVGSLVQSAQRTTWTDPAGMLLSVPGEIVSLWQRPFWGCIIVGGFLMSAPLFLINLDLFRTRPR